MSRKIKVLQLATSGITFKALLLPLISRLQQEGYAVHIACADDPSSRELARRGYSMSAIAIDRKIAPLSNLRSTWELVRLMRRERFDVVHVHTPVAAALGRVAAKLARVPIIIYTAHGFYFHEHMPPHLKRSVIWVEKLLGRLTDMLFTQSQEDADTAVLEGICPPVRVRCIREGVALHQFDGSTTNGHGRGAFGLSPDDVVIGFVGRVVREKGILDLVEAMHKVSVEIPDAKLLVVGDTLDGERDRDAKDMMREAISQNGLAGKVVFTGFIDDVPLAISAMDLLVLPSHREGMPRVIIEAMASSKPVVATNIRGCREEVVDGVTGLLVPVRDPHALAEAIVNISSQPQRAKEMGEAGLTRARKLFNEEQVIDTQVKIYRQLVETKLGIKEW